MELRYSAEVDIPLGKVSLPGQLDIPLRSKAMIIFAHGSGSSRFSTRNRLIARQLNEHNYGTLLFDLLTADEGEEYMNRFNINLLSTRLVSTTEWLEKLPETRSCRIGYFGASTGAASALRAAALLPQIGAVVCRGGRPDLAIDILPKVTAPTLLIVGSLDTEVLDLNKEAFRQLSCERRLEVVEGATHLFEEPGKLDIVSEITIGWFNKYLLPQKEKKHDWSS